MALATFKDLCIDARDPVLLGDFWAAALGLELHRQDDGDAHLTGPTPQHTIWVNRVPEPKTVKHRVHLDVNAGSVAELEALGATVLDADSLPVDGDGRPRGRRALRVRAGGPDRPAALRGRRRHRGLRRGGAPARARGGPRSSAGGWCDSERGFSYVDQVPGAPFDSLDFVPVPEPKTVKNRVHLDVRTADLDALLAAGATVLRDRDDASAGRCWPTPTATSSARSSRRRGSRASRSPGRRSAPSNSMPRASLPSRVSTATAISTGTIVAASANG